MKGRSLAAASALLVLVSCNAPEGDPKVAEKEIREQVGRYTAALDAADTNLASQVWDTAPDVSFIHPGGHAHGWEEVKGIYEFFGSAFSDRKLVARDIAVHVNGNTAWVEFYWHFTAKQVKDGAHVETDGRESQVYRKTTAGWRMAHGHYSGPAMAFQ
jgi:ketosteroid isomerase-like protein